MKGRLAVVIAALVVGVAAMAQQPPGSTGPTADEEAEVAGAVLDGLQRDIQVTTQRWIAPLQGMAQRLLFILLGVSLAWRFIESVLGGPDFGGIVQELVRIILYSGFFLAVIQFSPDWAYAVVESFMAAAAQVQGGTVAPLSPSGVLNQGVAFAGRMLDQAEWYQWLFVGLMGGLIVMMFAVIAGYVLLTFAEAYIVIAGGVLLLGFGGSGWTMEFAQRYLVYTVSVGAKLFALMLVVAFTQGIFATWADGAGNEAVGMFVPLGVVAIALMLVMMLPNMVQGIVNGSSIGSGGPALSGMMAGVSSAVAGGVMQAARMGMGAGAAAKGTAAAMGASSVSEAVRMDGGGARGAAKFAGKTALTVGRAMAGVAGARVASGGIVSELKGMQAAAEAERDAPADPAAAGVAAFVEKLGGGSVGPSGRE